MKTYYIYILTDKNQSIFYFDITDDLTKFCKEINIRKSNRENINFKKLKLVYYEEAENVLQAINHKKKLEKWDNIWKVILIEKVNPEWKDLSKELI